MMALPLAPNRAARLLLRACAEAGRLRALYDPDQARDDQGRWTSGSGFDADISDQYPIINEMRAYDEQDAKRVRSQLRQKGRLNTDGTTSLYHVTLNPDSITQRGLIPTYEKASGQDWQAEHSSYATYFFLDKGHAIDQVEQAGVGAVVEARIPITGETLSRFVPDEDSSPDIHDGVKVLVNGGTVAFIGGVPASAVKIIQRRGLAFNPDQPRDDQGRWTDIAGSAATADKLHDVMRAQVVDIIGKPIHDAELDEISETDRAAIKARVVEDLAERVMDRIPAEDDEGNPTLADLPDVMVQNRIDLWAASSGDHNTKAILMQRSIQEEFKLDDAEFSHLESFLEDTGLEEVTLPSRNSHEHEFNKVFARVQYERTQEWFRERGISEVEVFRGQVGGHVGIGSQTVTMQPASSWSVSEEIAARFANLDTESGVVMSARVPVSRVLSTAVTGSGCLTEGEIVILGGPIKVKVVGS